jgi:hypothetical protein
MEAKTGVAFASTYEGWMLDKGADLQTGAP